MPVGDHGDFYFPEVIVWMHGSMVVASDVVPPDTALLKACESLRNAIGSPSLDTPPPKRVRVSSRDLLEHLRAGLSGYDFVLGETPEVDEFVHAMEENFGEAMPGLAALQVPPPPQKKPRRRELKEYTSPERDLLTLLALWNTDMTRTGWAKGGAAAGLSLGTGKLTPAELLPLCERFDLDGTVEVTRAGSGILYWMTRENALRFLEDAQSRGRLAALHEVATRVPDRSNDALYSYGPRAPYWLTTELRVALLRGDRPGAELAITEFRRTLPKTRQSRLFAEWFADAVGPRPSPEWLADLDKKDAAAVAEHYFELHHDYLVRPTKELLAALPVSERARHALLHNPDNSDEHLAHIAKLPEKTRAPLLMSSAFFRGDHAAALGHAEDALGALGKRKYRLLKGRDGVIHALSALANAATNPGAWEHLRAVTQNAEAAKLGHLEVYQAAALLLERMSGNGSARLGNRLQALSRYREYEYAEEPWYVTLVFGLAHAFMETPSDLFGTLTDACWQRAEQEGYDGLAREFEGVAALMHGGSVPTDSIAARLKQKEPWEVGLESLALLAGEEVEKPADANAQAPFRPYLQWTASLGFNDQNASLSPREITSPRSTKGKPVALKRLVEGGFAETTDADREVLAYAEQVPGYSYYSLDWSLPSRAIVGLIDHPHVVRASGSPLQVLRGEARLDVSSEGESIVVTLSPERLLRSDFAFEEESADRVLVYERNKQLTRIAGALNGERLVVPASQAERLSTVLAGLTSRVNITANADVEVAGEDVEADATPTVRLGWDGTQLSAALFVAPLGIKGPSLPIGEGSELLAATLDGRALRTRRSLEEENARHAELIEECPAVESLDRHEKIFELDDALQLIGELHDAAERVVVVWPKGKKLSPPVRIGVSNMRVSMRESSEWLDLDVSVELSEEQVLTYRQLMENHAQRFVRVGKDQFLAISDELRKRLDAFEGIAVAKKSGTFASPVVLPLLAELAEGGTFELDEKSSERLAAFERAMKLRPRAPKAFHAELRDYQLEGFRWLARLAEAGLGACLADDMGLGKTIQTLALLCLRRRKGPALVVAPSSVASNWVAEAQRFAPSLRVSLLSESAERSATYASLGASDVLVCTYGLLQREGDGLSAVEFDSVVFDEAHLLKNAGTKRSKASKALRANFRLSLTGTPIENHLGELWSLMESTVPGLLGPAKRFERHYALPIADGSQQRADELRALLRPFMLRRTKTQVLDELPERTEVTLKVTPSESEAAFYEALRQRAVEQLSSANEDGTPSRITILAEITRLRQAAIDPRLIDEAGPRGTKIDELMERVLALRAEGHRVLVFSQFLGSLALVRAALEKAKVSFQSLDGSVSAAERARRIDAFQNGEGDVFVISLRAGGVGVNLTGADYVIHMDPWWNPAVEEQATARSHRIGQSRPVTVYRMISAGTIEEKILALHEKKRALAEDLLEGIDEAKKLDLAELRALIS